MGNPINYISIEGFKSIKNLPCLELHNLNILIGPNGAGKSNFINFFELLRAISRDTIPDFHVKKKGGADKFLYLGSKVTQSIKAQIGIDSYPAYELELSLVVGDQFSKASRIYFGTLSPSYPMWEQLKPRDIEKLFDSFFYHHFNDTSDFAKVKLPCTVRDYEYLRPDASNLAAFLLFLKKKHEKEYQRIRETIQLAAPFFDDFLLREEEMEYDKQVLLEWTQKGTNYPFHPSQMSDGTLRFICLTTALLQPAPPSTILLDEPELGLHPHALALLAGLIRKAATQTQVIVSTQSPLLIDYFEPQDIIVVNRENGESKFRRLEEGKLKLWLEDYSLGELWQKNIFEDSPGYE